jgi:hypothetical protein
MKTLYTRRSLGTFYHRAAKTLLFAASTQLITTAFASTDYGPAVYRPMSGCSKWYTSGNGHKFCVIHDMEGYYASTISYLNQCGVSVTIHYMVNGKQDASSDYAAGEIDQQVREAYYAWHARCWNTYSFGTEHEGFASNPAWFTEPMYQATAGLQRHLCNDYGIAKDRNHIVGHNAGQSSAWRTYAASAFGIDPSCNSHSDPGPYWDWSHLMELINLKNPPYTFNSDIMGWTPGPRMSGLNWNGTSWPGIMYGDQTGDDAYCYSPATSYTGPGSGVINVSVYPQNGTTANHNMQVFWKTSTDNSFSASKSSPVVNYTAQNSWIRLNLDVSSSGYVGDLISGLRLDFDQVNSGTRWIVNHVVSQSSLRWNFDANEQFWTIGKNTGPINWTACCGWPGVMYVDQTGDDAFIYSTPHYFDSAGPYKFLGAANDRIHVRVYPQNGTTANHDMQVFWKTTNDDTWTASKSSAVVNFTAQNAWADVYLNVGANPLWNSADNSTGGITEIRLDFDAVNQGTRWIIDYVRFEHN